jgi:hypothetical protein
MVLDLYYLVRPGSTGEEGRACYNPQICGPFPGLRGRRIFTNDRYMDLFRVYGVGVYLFQGDGMDVENMVEGMNLFNG